MIIESVCGCLVVDSNPTPYPYTHPIQFMSMEKVLFLDIQKHESFCEKSQAIKDEMEEGTP